MYACGAALTLEFLLCLAVSTDELARLVRGGPAVAGVFGVLSLVGLVLVACLMTYLGRSALAARREVHRRDQLIAADASTTHEWVWQSDVDCRLTYSNRGVQDLLGYTPEEVLGVSTFELLHDDAERALLRSLMDATSDTDASTRWDGVEAQWRHRDGHPVALTGSTVVIHDERDRPIGYRGRRRQLSGRGEPGLRAELARQRVSELLDTAAMDVALQPIVDLTTGRSAGVEALARFRDGRSPDLWFADAAEAGLLTELDRLAFTRALHVFDKLSEPAFLSINASPALVMDRRLRRDLDDSGAPLDRLVIEITEHAQVSDYDELNAALRPLRDLGVRFAVDDTGAGYASLNHVLQLRPDIIKLDRTLIAHLTDDRARRSLVTALLLLALDVGATVTGEGAETLDQLDTLTTLGVDHAQGYVLARPTTDPAIWSGWPAQNWPATVAEARAQVPSR